MLLKGARHGGKGTGRSLTGEVGQKILIIGTFLIIERDHLIDGRVRLGSLFPVPRALPESPVPAPKPTSTSTSHRAKHKRVREPPPINRIHPNASVSTMPPSTRRTGIHTSPSIGWSRRCSVRAVDCPSDRRPLTADRRPATFRPYSPSPSPFDPLANSVPLAFSHLLIADLASRRVRAAYFSRMTWTVLAECPVMEPISSSERAGSLRDDRCSVSGRRCAKAVGCLAVVSVDGCRRVRFQAFFGCTYD